MEYFKSEADKIIFALLETDGKTRSSLLGITEDLYSDEQICEEWYAKLSAILESSTNKRVEEAKSKLLGFVLNMRDCFQNDDED